MNCPECGSRDLTIEVESKTEIHVEGGIGEACEIVHTDHGIGDLEWDDDSFCSCNYCGNCVEVREFTKDAGPVPAEDAGQGLDHCEDMAGEMKADKTEDDGN